MEVSALHLHLSANEHFLRKFVETLELAVAGAMDDLSEENRPETVAFSYEIRGEGGDVLATQMGIVDFGGE